GGAFDLEAFVWSLQEVVRRHEILRTTFEQVETGPVQIIHPVEQVQVPCLDLSQLAAEERASEVQRLVETEAQQPFDLERGPLWRATVVRLGVREHALLFTMHHIISDGWSNGVLMRELGVLYSAFLAGRSSPLPDLPIQYADFAVWQRQWLQGERLDSFMAYWEKQLRGATAVELPTDHARPVMQSSHGARYPLILSDELSQKLVKVSHEEGVTLFMTLLAAFQVLLYRYTGQEDIVVGTDIASRTRAEIEPLIGFFINLLALRTDLSGKPSFRTLLGRVREMVLSAYAYQDMPFDMLVENLRFTRAADRTPLINVLFVLQNMPELREEGPEFALDVLGSEVTSSKFDMAVFVTETPNGLRVDVNYSTDLFELATVEKLFEHFKVLLQSVVTSLDTQIDVLDMYSDLEKEQQAQRKIERHSTYRRRLQVTKGEGIDLS
ncbi:MAG TPA: condensation domain-containing protein, partial [Ktedonobacteraceae bacterium]|nr:condensation domain-containing protein [Ktedonobacteraceae bacterium]